MIMISHGVEISIAGGVAKMKNVTILLMEFFHYRLAIPEYFRYSLLPHEIPNKSLSPLRCGNTRVLRFLAHT